MCFAQPVAALRMAGGLPTPKKISKATVYLSGKYVGQLLLVLAISWYGQLDYVVIDILFPFFVQEVGRSFSRINEFKLICTLN